MRLFGVMVDTASVMSWLGAGAIAAVGFGAMFAASRVSSARGGSAQLEIQQAIERSLA